jgi:hypothetical protein
LLAVHNIRLFQLGAIVIMFLKRLGIGKGKKSEYFLEAPAAISEAASDAKAAIGEAASDAKAALSEATSDAKAALAKPVELLKAAVTPDAKTASGAASDTSKQKKFKKTKSAADDAPESAAPQAASVAPAPVTPVAPAPVVPASASFATEHLLPKNTPRRRPGPSLDMFKDMAKQVSPRR